MQESIPSTRYIPLHVRFRNSEIVRNSLANEPLVPDLRHLLESERQAHLVKELLRLSHFQRNGHDASTLLQQIAASLAACTGFQRVTILRVEEEEQQISYVGFAGFSMSDQQRLQQQHDAHDLLQKSLLPEFRTSHSYYLPSIQEQKYADPSPSQHDRERRWQPGERLIVPLLHPQATLILGYILLTDPENKLSPTLTTIELIELFAQQVAQSLEYIRRQEASEHLEEALLVLHNDLSQFRYSPLPKRIHTKHPQLQPLVESLNALSNDVQTTFLTTQNLSQSVDEQVRLLQTGLSRLQRDVQQQGQQASQLSRVFHNFALTSDDLNGQTGTLRQKASEAEDVTTEALTTMDRSHEGMTKVREATLQSSRMIKALGERGQAVNQAVNNLTDLAARFHHLSLNAAIEATRSAATGNGFTVIARELRALATEESEVVRRITTSIRGLQQETGITSQISEQSTQQVVAQTELVAQTSVALEAVESVFGQVQKLAQEIVNLTQRQQNESQHVVITLGEVTRIVGDFELHLQEIEQVHNQLQMLSEALRERLSILQLVH